MAVNASSFAGRRLGAGQAILLGGLTIGVLDGFYAMALWGLKGVAPDRVFRGVAAGLLGRPAAGASGLGTTLLGLGLHFFIAVTVMAVYYLASRRAGVLTRRAAVCGLLYGIGVYFFMNYVVIPLSAIGPGSFDPWMFAHGVFFHAVLVGLPAALFSRAAAS